tara:strand:- start:832 stop:1428 length:597 start_codon:yes stop_codon:yes gene_type:complete
MQHQQSIQELFLKEFVLELIHNTKPTILPKIETPIASVSPQPRIASVPRQMPFIQSRKLRQMPVQLTPPSAPATNRTPIAQPPTMPTSPMRTISQTSLGLEKIDPILQDPSVQMLECPGPTRNLLVNRSGAIQTTSITLTQKEINDTLKQISEKTKIPLIPGVFKAAISNLLVTAVISEYAGTRFIIQKRATTTPTQG